MTRYAHGAWHCWLGITAGDIIFAALDKGLLAAIVVAAVSAPMTIVVWMVLRSGWAQPE